MQMKPHIKPTTRQLRLNAAMRRLPFYQQGAGHLYDTKHSKAWADYSYPLSLDFWFYYSMYKRVGLAHAVIERPVDMCWLTPPKVKISSGDEDIEDEQFDELAKRLRLWPQLKHLDTMQSVGHYAGAILRVADGKRLSDPIDRIKLDDIVGIMPAWEAQLIPGTLDNDPSSPRYGLPISYTYQQSGTRKTAQRDGNESFTVHHSRVLIWNEGAAGNTIYGSSRIEPCFNALIDWEKVRGAGGEGFWRQAAMRAVLQAMADTAGEAPSEKELDDLTEAITEMQDSFDSVPYLGGMELNTLQSSLSEPKGFAEVILQDVAAGANWSAKGLVGAQEGRLAGDQDSSLDKQTAQSRRENYLAYQIDDFVRWIEKYCSDFKPGERVIEFDDLMAPSDSARLDNAVKMQQVNQAGALAGTITFPVDEVREAAGFDPIEGEDIELPRDDDIEEAEE